MRRRLNPHLNLRPSPHLNLLLTIPTRLSRLHTNLQPTSALWVAPLLQVEALLQLCCSCGQASTLPACARCGWRALAAGGVLKASYTSSSRRTMPPLTSDANSSRYVGSARARAHLVAAAPSRRACSKHANCRASSARASADGPACCAPRRRWRAHHKHLYSRPPPPPSCPHFERHAERC
jgi:hypothetical protein